MNEKLSIPHTARQHGIRGVVCFLIVQVYIEKINRPMIDEDKATPAEYWAGLQHAIGQGWLEYHESGTFVRMKQAGKDLFT